ncbi:interferon-stimulated 20 kDa exonuclease-like 2 [Stegastes partitus]|uniref:Interferon stimulated exonuclease gene 20 like 2 n=1 Tax=Stegastes partitus TaxID=144197 RepID=A0A3B4ZQR5_9TELE|nr:PREDICTED: interferon-stimulated 20 kDa exonuclease-like 2 [Stegastes partitus]XP_008292095.1 PREDICTED: interferon-stimulated 20 kDa exonuclease-like 2 [Stegastes partitus]
MSDSRPKMCPAQGSSASKRKKKTPWFQKKMQYVKVNGYVADQHKCNHYEGGSRPEQTPHQNGAFRKCPPPTASTQSKGLPYQASTASASHCSSRPSASTHCMPSLTVTVFNQDCHQKPKEPVNTKSTPAGPGPSVSSSHKPIATPAGIPSKYLAIDCEMVGAGPKGSISQLARCSIVSYDGDVVYDKFIKPSMPITDYRTRWSGIRRSDLFNATPYSDARKEILKLLNGKVVIGHAIHNDFKALTYSHPSALTRDTSRIPLLNQRAGFPENQCASLKRLMKAIFNRDIQTGKKGHSSVEDARASMELYKVVEAEWERKLTCKPHTR